MKNYILNSFLLLILTGCFSKDKNPPVAKHHTVTVPASVLPPLSEAEKIKYHNIVENYLNHSLLRTNFNGGILIAKNGTIVYERYVGFKDLRKKDSLTAQTPLQIASTSKTLTSAAVLQLVQEGRLKLTDTLGKFFPGFPYAGITVKLLLDHRSGLPNYIYYMDLMGWDKHKMATNQDVINTLINWHPPIMAHPDKRFYYCNSNFVLLASIVEKVSGISFPEYMKKNIFEPLGMKDTYIRTQSQADSLRSANSYKANGGIWPLDFTDGPYGDKNVYSTPRDLLKWDQSLYNHTLLNEQTLDSAFTPFSNEKPSMHNYGLGWRLLYFPNGKRVIYHNGHWHGFNSAFDRLTDEKVTIIILGNRFDKNIYLASRKMYDLFGNYDSNSEPEGVE